MMTINWRFVFSKFWQITLMGLLIAVGIALFPQAQCAVAQTCDRPSDKWCGTGKCCDFTGGIKYVTRCNGPTYATQPYRCNPSSGNCNVTDWMGWPYETRIYNGRTQAHLPDCVNGVWKENQVWAYVDCCYGSTGGGGCTPSYAPPTIDDTYTVDPPYPVPWRQEQPPYGEALGMTINDIKAHGGADTACGSGQANITSLTVWVELTEESRDWIVYTLGQRYPGAHVLGEYPQYPERPDDPLHPYAHCAWTYGTSGINTPNAELDCRFFRPWDPGDYTVHVTACQSDGKCTTKVLPNPIKVYLLESRLLAPEP
ncbi:hypothetical protein ANT_24190 [Anaerolinea thermophila UNI-1]|uniref:Uncharacterized protein n=1 Tax=Anaerolinea thermophila (strain DSM 14523 / JCM 11388 / NBRC 100420 / UNI-1) TaxID=926569 RepID=E8MYV9_ANATU|nr:hypothetical protein [Anaerolinea thermolimosa]BAJ64445.1 hypothetical protein ANT_24190 [Anaerolinea thermophila UNI-1]